MKPAMLQSQFDILEEPSQALTLDVSMPVEEMVKVIVAGGWLVKQNDLRVGNFR
jgi:gluconate kinase